MNPNPLMLTFGLIHPTRPGDPRLAVDDQLASSPS